MTPTITPQSNRPQAKIPQAKIPQASRPVPPQIPAAETLPLWARLAPFWARLDWAVLLPLVGAAAFLVLITWPMLTWWHWQYAQPHSYYSQAPIVPVLIALMLWHRRDRLRQIPFVPSPKALLLLYPALGLLLFSFKTEQRGLQSLAFLLILVSSLLLLAGPRWVRAAAFPLSFLLLMPPLPAPLLNDATLSLQGSSTVLANQLLHLAAFGTTVQGNVIQMETYALFVDVPCSGFTLLLAMIMFSACFAFLLDGPVSRRVVLFLFSLPLSLLINGVRIALIGIVGECLGANTAATFHDSSGAITVVLGFITLLSLAKVLKCRTLAGWALF